MRHAVVVVGPGLAADPALLDETAGREFAALGVRGTVAHAADGAQFLAHVRAATSPDPATTPGGPGGERGRAVVVVPGPDPGARSLMTAAMGPVVWLDLARVDHAEVGEGGSHLHGRGIEGLPWAIRHAVGRLAWPRRRVPYGPHRDQWAELYLPRTPPGGSPPPVVALVHGGNWRSVWAADLMDALALDLVRRGLAVWNLEYRRPDLHGWQATTADVAAGLRALDGLDVPVDRARTVLAGHSAGAQLVLRAAADGARASLVVSLAGMLDLVEAARRWLGAGAVAGALGAAPDEAAQVYGSASPLHRLPIGVPQLVVQGTGDELDLVDFGRRYARAAQAAGDDVTFLEMSGDHFAVIDPRTPIWHATARAVLGETPDSPR